MSVSVLPEAKPFRLSYQPPKIHFGRLVRWLYRVRHGGAAPIVFGYEIVDCTGAIAKTLRTIKPGEKAYLQAYFPRPVNDEVPLSLRVSQAGQQIDQQPILTTTQAWQEGHVTPAGQRIFPSGPAPASRDYLTMLPFFKPAGPFEVGEYHFEVLDDAGQILSVGDLAVQNSVLKIKKPATAHK
jgi:hypothetical protein